MDRTGVCFEDRAAKGGDRPLAVGSRHMDHGRQTLLRIAKLGEQLANSIERKIVTFRMAGEEPLDLHGGEGSGRHILTTYASRRGFAKRKPLQEIAIGVFSNHAVTEGRIAIKHGGRPA